ncbi:MAG TPA: hypothetical protein VNK91_05690 [Burkholderiaceae bacterium]|jgi:hypothetical protein|nr:hypothetical protein [Burkholderiaceae bacterium]
MIEPIPIGLKAYFWTVLLVIAAPLALIAVCAYFGTGSLLGGSARIPVLIAYAVTTVVGAWLLLDLRSNQIKVGEGGAIELRGGLFYKRAVARSEIDANSFRFHPPEPLPETSYRTNGVGLPGYFAGWFKAKDGARMFVVYGGGPALSFSTRDGVRHLIGAADPQRLKGALLGQASVLSASEVPAAR